MKHSEAVIKAVRDEFPELLERANFYDGHAARYTFDNTVTHEDIKPLWQLLLLLTPVAQRYHDQPLPDLELTPDAGLLWLSANGQWKLDICELKCLDIGESNEKHI